MIVLQYLHVTVIQGPRKADKFFSISLWDLCQRLINHHYHRASDILWKKSKISRDFQGQIRGKIGRYFLGIFAGRKSKFTEKSADLWYFAGKKSKFVEKSTDFTGFSRKNVKFRRIFRGKFLEKSADFTGNFGGKLRQETISKKQPISLDFFWQISLKSINFALI